MAKSLNQVTVMGNLTRNPEIKTTPTGISVGNFSLALGRSYKDAKGEWVDTADFVDVTVWAKLAEAAADKLQKGSRVLVTGRISSRAWDDKETGKKRTKVEILGETIIFLSNEGMPSQEQYTGKDVVLEDIEDGPIDLSEIPF